MPDPTPSINNGEFLQAATLLNGLLSQATGKASLTATTLGDWVSQAQTAAKLGYDVLTSQLTQMVTRTIFASRPWERKLKDLYFDSERWGNHIRKVNYLARDFMDDDRYSITFNQDNPQQIPYKNEVIQTNFYGQEMVQAAWTIYKDQWDQAFRGPAELNAFVGGLMTEVRNQIEQGTEQWSRATLANEIGATILSADSNVMSTNAKADRVVNLCYEYVQRVGATLETGQTAKEYCMLPANFEGFIRFMFARIKTVSDKMTNRSNLYHNDIRVGGSGGTVKSILRHTPKQLQRLYLFSPLVAEIDARVLAVTFNPSYLTFGEREDVDFWQAAASPDSISLYPSYIDIDGKPYTYSGNSPLAVSDVVGILMDRDACGVTPINEWSAPAPFNAKHGFQTTYWHRSLRMFNDQTENSVVFLLA